VVTAIANERQSAYVFEVTDALLDFPAPLDQLEDAITVIETRAVGSNSRDFTVTAEVAPRLDGNDVADLVVGVPSDDTGGRAYVLYGPLTTGAVFLPGDAVADATVTTGAETGDKLGRRVVAHHDLTNDGLHDILLSAPDRNTKRGVVFLFPGGPPP
jgi:hypothetical protein